MKKFLKFTRKFYHEIIGYSLKKNLESMVDKNSIIENWREERTYKPHKSTISDSIEGASYKSTEKPFDIQVKEPEYAPEASVRLPILKQNTQIKDLFNHDIYQNGSLKTLRANSSVPEITFRQTEIGKMLKDEKESKESKFSSLHSHTRSQIPIYKERYDKNMENYLNSLDNNRYYQNASSAIGKLMSPNYPSSKSKHLDL